MGAATGSAAIRILHAMADLSTKTTPCLNTKGLLVRVLLDEPNSRIAS